MSKTFVFAFSMLLFAGPAFAASPTTELYRNTIQKNMDQVKACYLDRLKENPKLSGRLFVDWDIDDKGKVTRLVLNPRRISIKDDKLTQCVFAKIKSWTYKPAPKGKVVYLTFPFVFKRQ